MMMLREELKQTKSTLSNLQESWKHAKQVCDAWKVEAEGANTQTQMVERERDSLLRKMEKVNYTSTTHSNLCIYVCFYMYSTYCISTLYLLFLSPSLFLFTVRGSGERVGR